MTNLAELILADKKKEAEVLTSSIVSDENW